VQTSQALRGDLVFYEHPAHVTIIVARVNGVPMVISHGKEEGPFTSGTTRSGRAGPTQIRRYI
jgi:hypothetical protein